MFPEESVSWRGIERSLFPVSHTLAHRCSLCGASFTDRRTSIRVELGQRVLSVTLVLECLHAKVRVCFRDAHKKEKLHEWTYCEMCVFVCVVLDRWKLDHISFSSCIMTAWPGNRNNRYCIYVCVCVCVGLGGR